MVNGRFEDNRVLLNRDSPGRTVRPLVAGLEADKQVAAEAVQLEGSISGERVFDQG